MNPKAAPRNLILLSYTSSILIVIVGVLFGYMTDSINSILQWIVAGLYGGYIAPNVLKWHWWRFNGYGYFAGMVGGMAGSLVMPKLFPDMEQMYAFLVIFALSSLVSVVVSLLTRPEEMGVLKEFYKRTRPWGFWGPVCRQVQAEDSRFRPNRALAGYGQCGGGYCLAGIDVCHPDLSDYPAVARLLDIGGGACGDVVVFEMELVS
jgi:Na+/proline symporter